MIATTTATHRSVCLRCASVVILRPGTPVGTATDPSRLDAVAHVIVPQDVHRVLSLPILLDLTVKWECPVCDIVN